MSDSDIYGSASKKRLSQEQRDTMSEFPVLYHERPNEIIFGFRGAHSKRELVKMMEKERAQQELGLGDSPGSMF